MSSPWSGSDEVDNGQRARTKRSPRLELAGAYSDSRVRRGAAEEVAFRPGFVGRHPGVDHDRVAVKPELERQSVGVRVRREVGGRRRPAIEREPHAAVADDHVARLLEDSNPLSGLRQVECGRDVEAAVVEERRGAVRPNGPGSEAGHRPDRMLDVDKGPQFEQVAQDELMVSGAALVVAAVREHLPGQLSRKQCAPAANEIGVIERNTTENEGLRIADHVVTEHVVLNVGCDAGESYTQRIDDGRTDVGIETGRREPIRDPSRSDVRMPSIVVLCGMRRDPPAGKEGRARSLSRRVEHILAVMGVEDGEPRACVRGGDERCEGT